MAVIYLSHPIHGAKVAISDMEADNDVQNGWKIFDPTVLMNEFVEPIKETEDTVNALQPRRRGRRSKELTQE